MILVVIGVEVYLFVKPRKTNLDNIKAGDTASKKDSLKYIVDVTTSYLKNGLNYKVEKNGTKYYVLITGLKDKSLENKINTEIKKKVDENSKDSKTLVYNHVMASFSNVLSITINKQPYEKDYNDEDIISDKIYGSVIDSYNG